MLAAGVRRSVDFLLARCIDSHNHLKPYLLRRWPNRCCVHGQLQRWTAVKTLAQDTKGKQVSLLSTRPIIPSTNIRNSPPKMKEICSFLPSFYHSDDLFLSPLFTLEFALETSSEKSKILMNRRTFFLKKNSVDVLDENSLAFPQTFSLIV